MPPATRLRNEVRGAVASPSGPAATGMVPNGGVAVFFATGPENLYQFEQWRRPLERLAERLPVFVITDRADTGDALLQTTSLPLAFARGSARAGGAGRGAGRAGGALPQPGRGELPDAAVRQLRCTSRSGTARATRAGSVSNQHKAYDLAFVGGDAGRDRLGRALRGFDATERTLAVGRPQLDHSYPGAPAWPRDSGLRVWYAPTWEGDRPSIAYGSLASHGVAIIEALLADPSHPRHLPTAPRTGYASREHREADKADPRPARDRPATGTSLIASGYGWQWDFADACITDISAVAYDWLATGKPLVITEPAPSAYRPPSPLLDALPLLDASGGRRGGWPESVSWKEIRQPESNSDELASHYFGDVSAQQSTKRFEAAIERALPAPTVLIDLRGLRARAGSRCRRRVPSAAAFACRVPEDSALGRPSNSQQTAPASGRQMIAVAQSQRGIRRTAYGGA